MAQLHEFQAKAILAEHGIEIPRGQTVDSAIDASRVAASLGPVVIKAQIHSTSRAAAGGVRFAETSEEAEKTASEMLGTVIGGNLVEQVLVDEKLDIDSEYYLGFIIDDVKKRPRLMFSASGGSGIEDRAASMNSMLCSIREEPNEATVRDFIASAEANISAEETRIIANALLGLYRTAKSTDARTAEINPFVKLKAGSFVAADARMSVDDYAAFRHPELNIEIARELGHTPTKLERIAWEIEKEDFRGTFYFVEILNSGQGPGASSQQETDDRPSTTDHFRIGFHGAGGGGSMASLDAAQRNGLAPACYVDTSGNPPASKVYRAARIILSMPGIGGYFLSGSGVASQEQFVLARAVLKAFLEVKPAIPSVLRLGGNGEDIAKEMVERYSRFLPAPVEAYRKRDTADFCAARLRELIESEPPEVADGFTDNETNMAVAHQNSRAQPPAIADGSNYVFATRTGTITYFHEHIDAALAQTIVDVCPQKILELNEKSKPVLAISEEEAERGKCSECLACEFAAMDAGNWNAVKIDFPIPGLD